MNMTSPHDVRYRARWVREHLEVFQDGKSIGKVRVSTVEKAKEIFNLVIQSESSLENLAYFHEISRDMIGVDLSKMRYSKDRQTILYQGQFFADVESTVSSQRR